MEFPLFCPGAQAGVWYPAKAEAKAGIDVARI
jgi:hypothetical protein